MPGVPATTSEYAKTIRESKKTVLFGHRSPTNLNDKNADSLAALVEREYNAPFPIAAFPIVAFPIVNVTARFVFPIVNATTFSGPFK